MTESQKWKGSSLSETGLTGDSQIVLGGGGARERGTDDTRSKKKRARQGTGDPGATYKTHLGIYTGLGQPLNRLV